MQFESLTLRDFISELGSGTPVPGGGSIAAICGAFAAALSTMVSRLTLGREKFRSSWDEIGKANESAIALTERFLALSQEDSDAYRGVIAAYQLPKGTEEQKALREGLIQRALKNATTVPLETLRASESLIVLAVPVLKKGNPNALTDAGAAIHLLRAAAYIAAANVKINLQSIRDEDFVSECKEEVQERLGRIETLFGDADGYLQSNLP